MIVTFCGHRQISNQAGIADWLDLMLPSLIEGGATTFYLGGYGDFDQLAAAAVMRQKVSYPSIEAVLVLPYPNQKIKDSNYDQTAYPIPGKVPPRLAIVKRNQWMVEQADVVISAVIHNWGGAAKTLHHARQKGKVIFQYPLRDGEP